MIFKGMNELVDEKIDITLRMGLGVWCPYTHEESPTERWGTIHPLNALYTLMWILSGNYSRRTQDCINLIYQYFVTIFNPQLYPFKRSVLIFLHRWMRPGRWTHKCPSNIQLLWNQQWSRCTNYVRIVREKMNTGQRLITSPPRCF